jgi:hypothetical protein
MSRPLIIRPLTPRPQAAPLDRRWFVSGLLLLSVWLLTLTLSSALLNLAGVVLNGDGQAQLQAHGHPFVDARELWAMPNAADVLSNLPFVAVGVIGLWRLRRLPKDTLVGDTQRALKVFFCGLVLTGLLSAVYHWQPDAWGLALDRTGMAVGFAGVLALAAADRVGQREARLTLWVVLPLAIVSAWLPLTHDNELPWAVVQFGGIALVLSVAWRPRVGGGLGVCWVGLIAIYALAKCAEVSAVRPAAPAPLRALLLDAVPRRRQRQPVQVRLHRAGDLPAAGELAAAGAGRAGDRRAVHPAVPAVLGHQRPAGRQVRQALLIRWLKRIEIAIMALAAWGFFVQNVPVLLACIFLMGLQSTVFGPVKFAYLPQHLNERELTGGNGMVEMGTFVAILLGNVAGGLIIAVPEIGAHHVLHLHGAGRAGAPDGAPVRSGFARHGPGLRINWNPFTETWRNLKLAHGNAVVFRSVLGISWMWFFGAVFLSQFPALPRTCCTGNEQVASLLLVVFSIGIGSGSLLCEVLSRRHVEIGLVPLGAIGMSVFAVDLYFASRGLPPAQTMGCRRSWPSRRTGACWPTWRCCPVRRPVQRADVRADPDAQPAHAPRAHHRRQQHPQRAVHDRQRRHRGACCWKLA